MKLTDIDLAKPVECIATNLLTGKDRLVREQERKQITSISRSQAYQLEKEGRFPKRVLIGRRSVAWCHSELMTWVKHILETGRPVEQTNL